MTSDDDLTRTAFHEAGHSVVAWRVGRALGPVTIEPGIAYNGCSWSTPRAIPEADWGRLSNLPGPLWPARIRRHCETAVMVSSAGALAALHLAGPRMGRTSASLAERVEDLLPHVPRPGLTAAEAAVVAEAAAAVEVSSDDRKIAQYAAVFCDDDPSVAGMWVTWLERVTVNMLVATAGRVERVALALLEHKTIGKKDVLALVEQR